MNRFPRIPSAPLDRDPPEADKSPPHRSADKSASPSQSEGYSGKGEQNFSKLLISGSYTDTIY